MKKNEYELALRKAEKPYLSWIDENEENEYLSGDFDRERDEILETYEIFAAEDASIEERLYAYLLNSDNADFIYTDEDMLDEDGNRTNPYFKAEWSPETILSYYYPSALTIVKREIADEVSRKFPYKRGSNEFLRECALVAKSHLHIGEVLVHTRRETSLEYENLPEIYKGQIKITALILSKDHPEILEKCVVSLNKAASSENVNLRIIVVDNGSNPENEGFYEGLAKLHGFEYHMHPMNFEYSTLCNYAASLVRDDDLLFFLNDDVEVPEGMTFLAKMASMAMSPQVGAVGCKLLYPDEDKIQHNGITLLKSGPSHRLCTYTDSKVYCRGVNTHSRNVLAVTGAALICEAKKFRQIGGFDERIKVAYTDLDLCMAFMRAGYRNVCMSDFYLIHHESLSREDDIQDKAAFERLKSERKIYEDKYADIIATGDIYESRNWSNLSLDYIPDVLTEEDNYRVINRLQPFNRGKIFLRKAGKKFFSSLDSVNFKLNDAGGNENFYEIRGWAFAGGCPGYEYDVKIILENEGKRFVFDCARTLRPDVEMVFPTQRDCRLSGFVAKISADIIPKGENKIYIALVKPALLSKSRFKGAIRDSGRVLELK